MCLSCLLLLLILLPSCTPGAKQSNVSAVQHRQWAQELLTIHDIDGAISEMSQALSGNPNIDDALLYADLLESKGQYKKARSTYKKAFKYPADNARKQTLTYRLAVLEISSFDNLKSGEKYAQTLPPVDSRYFDLKSLILLKQGQLKKALTESQRALEKAKDNEEKGWAYFHMAQIYYELRIERDTFGSLFHAVNNGRGYSLVNQITVYWDDRRHVPFPKN